MSPPSNERTPQLSLQQVADRKALDKYAPPGVLVGDQLTILQFRGQTAEFISPSPGTATLSLPRLIRPELLVPMKNAVQRAAVEGVPVRSSPVPLTNAQHRQATVDVLPVEAGQNHCLLILRGE